MSQSVQGTGGSGTETVPRSQIVAEYLPTVRRYARVLAGSQASGDDYVAAMLESLSQGPQLLDERHGPRVGLLRLFSRIWNSVSIGESPDVALSFQPSERRLASITPLPRQAFLLLSLEGLTEDEVGFVLDTDIEQTRMLADAAGREIAAELATDVLIIEDGPFVATDLVSSARNMGHNVVGVARTHADAMLLAKKKPRVVIADK
jgi:DNA-directed RNA polymerase specialized sigma24 family protein